MAASDRQPSKKHWFKRALWRLSHLYFPIVIHFLTDKYERKHHHLAIDLIYVSITFVLVATNIGLGVWFYLFLTPAELDVQIVTNEQVVSGELTQIELTYANPSRAIQDVEIDVLLPEGVAFGAGPEDDELLFPLGDLESGVVDTIPITGTVFGSVGEEYVFQFVSRYTYLGRRQTEVTPYVLRVVDSSFVVEVDLPSVVVYDTPVEITVFYENRSTIPRSAVSVALDLPSHFTVQGARQGDLQLGYTSATPSVELGPVGAQESGSFTITGRFTRLEGVVIGDQESVIGATATTSIESEHTTVPHTVDLSHATIVAPVQIVQPRVRTFFTASEVVNMGESIVGTITVENVGDRAVEDVALSVAANGAPVTVSSPQLTVVQGDSSQTASTRADDGRVYSPVIDRIETGERAVVSVRIPTSVVAGQQLSSTANVRGTAYSPTLDSTIPVEGSQTETRYNSRLQTTASSFYTGPAGEQLGYGPYPPRPWEPTALRVVLSVENLNNAVSGTTVRTTLPSQVEWTGLYSVSAGSQMQFSPLSRELVWTIPSLRPQEQAYGAQFEVVITPNHLQVGQQPLLTDDFTLSANDSFTGSVLTQRAGAVRLPVQIVE